MQNKMKNLFKTAIIIILLALIKKLQATHFDGGFMTAQPIKDYGSAVEIEFTVRFAYRRDWTGVAFSAYFPSRSPFCDQDTISNYGKIAPYYDITCEVGCAIIGETIGTTEVICIAFSVINNWSLGENRFRFNVTKTSDYQVLFTQISWRPLVVNTIGYANSDWQIRLKINTTLRSDINAINHSPITLVPPVVQLRTGLIYFLELPIYDADGDTVRCRWSNFSRGECGGKFI